MNFLVHNMVRRAAATACKLPHASPPRWLGSCHSETTRITAALRPQPCPSHAFFDAVSPARRRRHVDGCGGGHGGGDAAARGGGPTGWRPHTHWPGRQQVGVLRGGRGVLHWLWGVHVCWKLLWRAGSPCSLLCDSGMPPAAALAHSPPSHPSCSVLVEGGAARGILTSRGQERRARAVLVNADPYRLRQLAGGTSAFPPDFNARLDAQRKDGTTMKVEPRAPLPPCLQQGGCRALPVGPVSHTSALWPAFWPPPPPSTHTHTRTHTHTHTHTTHTLMLLGPQNRTQP
jgi:hypothetical protein